MPHRVAEEHFHTREQIAEHVLEAASLADELQLSDEDRAVLLPWIAEKLAAKQVWFGEMRPIGGLDLPRGVG
jgi:hypothetical protein